MALYHNGTRLAAIVTLRVLATPNPEKTLEIGTPSTMKSVPLDVGVHDIMIGPFESIEFTQGADVHFLASRGP